MIDDGYITKEQSKDFMKDLINTDLPSDQKKGESKYKDVIMSNTYQGNNTFNPYTNYMNPMMLQQMYNQQGQQNNPYSGYPYGARGREISNFPFGMPRRKRRLTKLE